VEVAGGMGYNSADDVASIVNHEAYQTTGYLPASYKVPDLSVPGASGAGPRVSMQCGAGIVETIRGWLGLCAQPAAPVSSGFSLSSITGTGTMWIALVIFGFIGALALIGYSGALKRSV